MIKPLLIITTLCATAQAAPFSMDDYKAKTGKTAIVIDAPKVRSLLELSTSLESTVVKLQAREVKLKSRIQTIDALYAAQASKPLRANEDRSKTMKEAARDRKTRLFGVNNELRKVEARIAGLKRAIAYYEDQAKLDKVGQKLRAEGWIS